MKMAAQVAETTRRAGAQDLDEAQIRKLVTDVIEAWNEHDARAYSRHCADDADLTTVIGTTAHGREAIHAHIAEVFKSLFKKSHITAKTIWVRFLNPEIAVVDIRWQMIGALDWDGNILPTRQGLLNWIVTRQQDGRWLVTVMHNQELTPLRY
jgi:uncharacterized protein (TIGR02246 family)